MVILVICRISKPFAANQPAWYHYQYCGTVNLFVNNMHGICNSPIISYLYVNIPWHCIAAGFKIQACYIKKVVRRKKN